MKRSGLGPGRKSLERGTSFKAAPKPLERRSPLKSDKRIDKRARRRNSTLNPGRGFAASPAQQAKVRGAISIVSGQGPCDPAHVFPRSLSACDDPLCVVPLTRWEHDCYDNNGDPNRKAEERLDLLPYLLAHKLVPELQHALGHANGDLIGLLHVLTGERWQPVPDSRAA